MIESNPANLDPRFATDGQSQHLDGLIFSSLVARDEQMNLQPDLAERWETPDALTYIFYLRRGVRFHDGTAVTAADVKATFDFVLNSANRSPKRGGFRMIASVEARDANTVVFHLNGPYASFLWSVSRPAIGIVPANAGADFSRRLIGSGPFKFVSQAQDDEVVLAANADYFGGAPGHCAIARADRAGCDCARAGIAKGVGGPGDHFPVAGYGAGVWRGGRNWACRSGRERT